MSEDTAQAEQERMILDAVERFLERDVRPTPWSWSTTTPTRRKSSRR